MTHPDPARLRAVLGGPALARVRRRLRERVERSQPLTGTASFTSGSEQERTAIDRLLGRVPSRGKSVKLDLNALERQLRDAGLAPDLRSALEAVDGPITEHGALRREAADAWDQALAGAAGLDPAWLADPATRAALHRAVGGDPAAASSLLASVAAVLARLPHPGTTRPVLAAAVTGDAHALDPQRPLARLVASALAFGTDAEPDEDPLAANGVFHQDLTRTVLALNLPGVGGSWLARTLRLHAEAAEPLHLTLRQLARATPADFASVGTVFACENPAVVGVAAARLGPHSAPLVCVCGQPGSAAHRLFRLLREAGAALRYHGDFDAAGLGIARGLIERHGAEPWRMGAADYLAAVAAGRGSAAGEAPVAATPWDPPLAEAFAERRQVVHEEALVEDLLRDLGSPPGSGPG